jgi:signal transduction histidine kinase
MYEITAPDSAARWLPSFPLLPLLSIAGLACLGMLFLSLWLSLQQPWLGVETRPDTGKGSWIVTAVGEAAAGAGLKAGDSIVAFAAPGHASIPFHADFAVEDPETLRDFQAYNRFFERQEALDRLLHSDRAELRLADGSRHLLTPAPRRPWWTLPLPFWIVNGFTFFCVLMGVGIWGHRRGRATTRLLVMGCIGILLASSSMVVYGFREFALDGELFLWLHRINHIGVFLWGYTMVTLLWFYPQPINRFPAALLIYPAAVLLCVNEWLQLFDWPLHTFYLPAAYVPFTVVLVLAAIQWRRSVGLPLDRAAMRLFLISVLLTSGVAVTLYAAPPMVGAEPLIPLWVGHLSVFLVYGGFALGVLRYRLFDVEWWWLQLWRWFFVALAFLGTDLLLLAMFKLQPANALGLSLALVAWLYIPLRQWGWGRLFRHDKRGLEAYLPQFLQAQFSQTGDGERAWSTLLESVFLPLSLARVEHRVEHSRLVDNGLMLRVPSGDGEAAWLLSGKQRGTALFDRQDAKLAEGLLNLTRQALQLRQEKGQAAERERRRIARDLHDDVGAQLLTVIHGAESTQTARQAQEALRALRESIHALRQEPSLPLGDLLADWRHEVLNRLELADVELQWHDDIPTQACFVTGRQRINLTRMLREAVTNALRHGVPDRIRIDITQRDDQLVLRVSNDGPSSPPETWKEGAGMAGIRSRAAEIDARVEWRSDETGATFMLTMPFDQEVGDEDCALA